MSKVRSEEITRMHMLHCTLLRNLKLVMVTHTYKPLKKIYYSCKTCSLRFTYVYKVPIPVATLKISNPHSYNRYERIFTLSIYIRMSISRTVNLMSSINVKQFFFSPNMSHDCVTVCHVSK